MSGTVTFGIVGGYGASGRAVASELWKCSAGNILIGGPNLDKATALAEELRTQGCVRSQEGTSVRSQEGVGVRSEEGSSVASQGVDGTVSAVTLDVLDARSLDEFCSQCSVIVNCAGPVTVLEDRVAQSAFRNRCHYIDAAGMSIVKERMLPHSREIQDLGLCKGSWSRRKDRRRSARLIWVSQLARAASLRRSRLREFRVQALACSPRAGLFN